MSAKKKTKRKSRRMVYLLLLYILAVYGVRAAIPPPSAVENRSPWRTLENPELLIDTSWESASGVRQLDQHIFDAVLRQISEAKRNIVLDMFLMNDWQGSEPETHRALVAELTTALIQARTRYPQMPIIVITDPVNTVYGGVESVHLDSLREAGVTGVITPLVELQDSNPLYSAFWRGFIRPFGNKANQTTVPAPFGNGKVSIRSWLAMLNFKANHRKLLVPRGVQDDSWRALVSSANPHDGSSAHRNIALQFDGAAAHDVLRSEHALLELAANTSDENISRAAKTALEQLAPTVAQLDLLAERAANKSENHAQIRVLTERAILDAVLASIDVTTEGDAIDVLMFYLSHRSVVRALDDGAIRLVNNVTRKLCTQSARPCIGLF